MKLKRLLSSKTIAVLSVILLVIALIPVLYLTTVNHSTGDDLGYGEYVHAYLCGRGGFTSVFDALGRTLKQYYDGWQGTWFSIILFALQPGVFSEKLYVLVAPVALLLWFGSSYYLYGFILKKKYGYDRWSTTAIITVFLLLSMEYIPSTKSSIFWYNGVAHYMIPFSMTQIAMTWMLKWTDQTTWDCENNNEKKIGKHRRIGYLIGVCLFMTLLGGSSYQCALFVLIPCVYLILWHGVIKKKKHVLLLLIPTGLELTELVISAKAPGNKIRGGADFGFSATKAVNTIGMSFVKEGRDLSQYVLKNPILFAGLVLFALLILWISPGKSKDSNEIKKTGISRALILPIVHLWCLSSAIEAPEIYAGVEVSGGVHNAVYQTILISIVGTVIVIANRAGIRRFPNAFTKIIITCVITVCLVILFLNKGRIKDTTTYKSYHYISTGQAADYKDQMKLQDELLTSGDRVVVIPEVNHDQGPLMQMPVVNDPDSFTNSTTRYYYDLDSIEVIDRNSWNQQYGE